MENELPKEDIIQLLNSQQVIKCEKTTIDEVAKALRIDNDENGITPSGIEAEFYDTSSNIPDPSKLDRSQRTLIVFDAVRCFCIISPSVLLNLSTTTAFPSLKTW